MEKIIHKLINEFIEGIDTYTHNGSTWLIFTESKQWVIELTESKTLWYNYSFFQEVFIYTSLNVVEHQQYITKWAEDNIINKVKETDYKSLLKIGSIEDTIENGVRHTDILESGRTDSVEDTIKNGVKETITSENRSRLTAENIIENGVKETQFHSNENKIWIEGVIEDGIKETFDCDWDVPTDLIEDVITDGVKNTRVCNYTDPKTQLVWVKWGYQIDEVIESGIKETKTPGDDGDIVGVMNWMLENKTNSVPEMINDIIENGVKTELMWIKWDNHLDEIAEKNIKKTKPMDDWVNTVRILNNVINEGVKETKSIGKESPNYPTPVINHIIINGVKETKGDASQNPMGKVTKVIKEGIKNPTY